MEISSERLYTILDRSLLERYTRIAEPQVRFLPEGLCIVGFSATAPG
jgi:hypothetical protein